MQHSKLQSSGPLWASSSTANAFPRLHQRGFFLDRQSWLAELVLDRAQEGLRVAAEAAAQDTGSAPLLELVADNHFAEGE